MKELAKREFECELVRETAYHRERIGVHKSVMTLFAIEGQYIIEWEIDGEFAVEIGIWTEHMKVTEYDGVFELFFNQQDSTQQRWNHEEGIC